MKADYRRFIKDLEKLCQQHRVTLYAANGIEVYESGYYLGVDDPFLPIIKDVSFDSDEGKSGEAWVDFIEATDEDT